MTDSPGKADTEAKPESAANRDSPLLQCSLQDDIALEQHIAGCPIRGAIIAPLGLA